MSFYKNHLDEAFQLMQYLLNNPVSYIQVKLLEDQEKNKGLCAPTIYFTSDLLTYLHRRGKEGEDFIFE